MVSGFVEQSGGIIDVRSLRGGSHRVEILSHACPEIEKACLNWHKGDALWKVCHLSRNHRI